MPNQESAELVSSQARHPRGVGAASAISARPFAARLVGAALVAGAVTATWIGAPTSALAHGGDSGGQQLPLEVHTVSPDGGRALEILTRLEKDAARASIARESIGKSKRALQRADGAAAAGDTEGARLLSRLALAHASAADATLRARDAEAKANQAQTTNAELHDKLVRTKTLLAETQAQRGQIAAELAHAEEEAKANAAKAQSKEDARLDKSPDKTKGEDKPKSGQAKRGGEKKPAHPSSNEPEKKHDKKKGAP